MPRCARQKVGRSWKERIEGGRPLTMGEVDTLGSKPSAEYLRAMGVKVDRSEQKERRIYLDAMHARARSGGAYLSLVCGIAVSKGPAGCVIEEMRE